MLWVLKRLRDLFRHRRCEPVAISGLAPQIKTVVEHPQSVVKLQSEELTIRVVTFLLHHYQHCAASDETSSQCLSSSSTFTLFALLPAEIRIKIWKEIIASPHTVELSCTPASQHNPQGRWFSHSGTPTVLHINSESRTVALRKFSILNFSPEQIGAPPRPIYVNFSSARLWLCEDLGTEWARDLLEKNDQLRDCLKSLVVSRKLWQGLNPTVVIQPDMPVIMRKWKTVTNVSESLKVLESIEFHG